MASSGKGKVLGDRVQGALWGQAPQEEQGGQIRRGVLGLAKTLVHDTAKVTQQVNGKADSKPTSPGSRVCGVFTPLRYKGPEGPEGTYFVQGEFKEGDNIRFDKNKSN